MGGFAQARDRCRGGPWAGSGRGGARRATSRGQLRAPRELRARRSSTRGRSDTATADQRRTTDRRAPAGATAPPGAPCVGDRRRRRARGRDGARCGWRSRSIDLRHSRCAGDLVEGPLHVSFELGEREARRRHRPADQVCPPGYGRGRVELPDDGARPPPEAVPGHGVARSFAERTGDARRGARRVGLIGDIADPHRTRANPPPMAAEFVEGGPIADAPDQADSRLRPLRRRAFSTARPARSAMRWRNPWRLARRRVLGWKVRFTEWPPRAHGTCRGRHPRPREPWQGTIVERTPTSPNRPHDGTVTTTRSDRHGVAPGARLEVRIGDEQLHRRHPRAAADRPDPASIPPWMPARNNIHVVQGC